MQFTLSLEALPGFSKTALYLFTSKDGLSYLDEVRLKFGDGVHALDVVLPDVTDIDSRRSGIPIDECNARKCDNLFSANSHATIKGHAEYIKGCYDVYIAREVDVDVGGNDYYKYVMRYYFNFDKFHVILKTFNYETTWCWGGAAYVDRKLEKDLTF